MFNQFRGVDWMPEPCRSCPRNAVDYGGCRCQAFQLTGDAAATDPVCHLSPQHAIVVDAVRAANAETVVVPEFVYRQNPSRRAASKRQEVESAAQIEAPGVALIPSE